MTFLGLCLVLLSALMHASWNLMIKSSKDTFISMALITLSGSLCALSLTPFFEFPGKESWLFIGLSMVVHLFYGTFLSMTYQISHINIAYPIARGSAPIFVALISWLFLEEMITSQGYWGVGLICLGILGVTFKKRNDTKKKKLTATILCSLITGLTICSYTLIDGTGMRTTKNMMSYVLWLQIANGIGIMAWTALKKNPRTIYTHFKNQPLFFISGGLLTFFSYGIILFLLTVYNFSTIAALREVSVVFVAFLGSYLFKEPLGRKRMISAFLVVIGIVMINTSKQPISKKDIPQKINVQQAVK